MLWISVWHDIVKKRLDHLGKVIDSRKGDIGAPQIERPLQKHGGRLDKNEKYCGSCYGAEGSDDHCCNTCEEVREAYRNKGWAITNMDFIDQCKREGIFQKIQEEQGEGCNIHGFVDVKKVAGNIHFAPGKSFRHLSFPFLDLFSFQAEYNISHKINKLSFGKEFPGVINPLDGTGWIQPSSSGIYQYFIKENEHSSMYTWILSTGWWQGRAPINPDSVIIIGFLCTCLVLGFVYINRVKHGESIITNANKSLRLIMAIASFYCVWCMIQIYLRTPPQPAIGEGADLGVLGYIFFQAPRLS